MNVRSLTRQGFSSNKVDDYEWAFPRDEEVMDRSSQEVFTYILYTHKRVQGRIGRALVEMKIRRRFLIWM